MRFSSPLGFRAALSKFRHQLSPGKILCCAFSNSLKSSLMAWLAQLCLKTELSSQLTWRTPWSRMAHVFQSICQLKLLFWEVCLDFCQSDEFMDIPYFFNYLDIGEGFPIVRWEKFFENLHPGIRLSPSSVVLWNMHLPLTTSLSIDRIWRENSMSCLIFVLLLFFFFLRAAV